MKLHPDLSEFLESLNRAEVRYLVVGGYAVAAHGHVRYTKDLDVWLESSRANAARVLTALQAFGLGSLDITVDDLCEQGMVIQLGNDPARIDLLTSVSGLDFAFAYPRRIDVFLGEVAVAVPCREDLASNKRASGRARDLADLDDLGLPLSDPRNA
ncbi:MAG: DUF6036 family nucleotidyltransferase [Pseudomarimonas sp.]